ncbi:hypothetical protein L873DRAFT_1794653 [Choiromyces venosus 120613-1]|uniref:CCHC-type domain-containing protein n=1 Tax=Choiromyces venosus 120613-1 TaxID=1336337 RepID=A0A3N4J087_9PEZI|nr:hypothetical protein L873DRAFT_1794653 [Choiromyces venosus 120613-1]
MPGAGIPIQPSQFHDSEVYGGDQEDILSIMSNLRQGNCDVFTYSHEVLKLLHHRSIGMKQFDRTLIHYYIDGLSNKHLREISILSFLKPDSQESPHQVVKAIMRLATQLKHHGYQKYRGSQRGAEESSDDDESSGDKSETSEMSSKSDDDYWSSRKSTLVISTIVFYHLGVYSKIDQRSESHHYQAHYRREPECVGPGTRVQLDGIQDGIQGYSDRYSSSSFQEPKMESYRQALNYQKSSPPEPIVGPNRVLYYPAHSRVCYYCREEGYFRNQCPKLHNHESVPLVIWETMHFETSISTMRPPMTPSQGDLNQVVNVVEVATKYSALYGMKVREVSAAEVNLQELIHLVERIFRDRISDESEESENKGKQVMAGQHAQQFWNLAPEFNRDPGPVTQRARTDAGTNLDKGA